MDKKKELFETDFDDIFSKGAEISKSVETSKSSTEDTPAPEKLENSKKIKRKKDKVETKLSRFRDKVFKKRTLRNWIELGVMVVLAIVLIASIVYKKILEEEIENEIVFAKVGKSIGNTPNYIYINKDVHDITVPSLKKILFDNEKTILYFNKNIDLNDYIIFLIDEYGNYYSKFEANTESLEFKIATLEPVKKEIKRFEVVVLDRYDKFDHFFNVKLDKKIDIKNSKYSLGDYYVKNIDKRSKIKLSNAVFSQSASTTTLFVPKGSKDVKFRYGLDYVDDKYIDKKINLIENKNYLNIYEDQSKSYEIRRLGGTMHKISFEPLKMLNNKIRIEITGLFIEYYVNKTFNVRDLLLRNIDDYKFELDNYEVRLEGLRQYGDYNVLVADAIDLTKVQEFEDRKKEAENKRNAKRPIRNIYDDIEEEKIEIEEIEFNEDDAKVSVYIKAYLEVFKDEEFYRVYGEPKVKKEGTDIVFFDERLKGLTSRDFKLVIENVAFKEETGIIDIDVNTLDEEAPPAVFVKYKEFADEYFGNQIGGKLTPELAKELKGDIESIIFNEKQWLLISYIANRDEVIAIVLEEWHGETDKEYIRYNAEHEVTIRNINGELILLKDILHNKPELKIRYK